MGDWRLIERGEQEIKDLLQRADIPPGAARLRKEETGLTFIVEISKIGTGVTEPETRS
jgi:hypothetical protein